MPYTPVWSATALASSLDLDLADQSATEVTSQVLVLLTAPLAGLYPSTLLWTAPLAGRYPSVSAAPLAGRYPHVCLELHLHRLAVQAPMLGLQWTHSLDGGSIFSHWVERLLV